MPDFHLSAIQLGDEAEMLERTLHAFNDVEPGELIVLPEYIAWTPSGSGEAFARLIAEAQRRKINIVTTLNLAGELIEDLPGHAEDGRYNAIVIFTRHGVVHVPQAKITPQAFEMSDEPDGPNIAVEPYGRLNRVPIDLDGKIYEFIFLVCSDVAALYELNPPDLECDALIVVANFANGAELCAQKLLEMSLAHGIAPTALFVNSFQVPTGGRTPLCERVELMLEPKQMLKKPSRLWKSRPAIRSKFFVYEDDEAKNFVEMCELPRKGRIAVAKSVWPPTVEMGRYPITVVF